MIATRLLGIFTRESLKKITTKSHEYNWTDTDGQVHQDGPTILFLIMQIINPTTVVGVSGLKMSIQNSSLNKHNHNVLDMFTKMEEDYQSIIGQDATHDDYLLHLFNALETSKNTKFLTWVSNQRTD